MDPGDKFLPVQTQSTYQNTSQSQGNGSYRLTSDIYSVNGFCTTIASKTCRFPDAAIALFHERKSYAK